MPKTIEEMTISEIEALVRRKRRAARKAPRLRQEQAKILARLKEIDEFLAAAGFARGRRSQAKSAAKAPVKAKAGKRGETAVSRILEFLSDKGGAAPRPTEMADALGININTIRPTLSKLVKAGRVETDQGVYWVDEKKAPMPAPERRKTGTRRARRAVKGGNSVKQRLLDYLGKTNDLHRTAEIRKALPGVKPQYMYNLLGGLKKEGMIVHENGLWGMRLPF